MDLSHFSTFKSTSLRSFYAFRALKCHQLTMLVALWRTGMLCCLFRFCACSAEECILGVVGQPVSLPCLQPELLSLGNFSLEWRRDDKVVLRSVFEDGKNVEELSRNSATIPANASQTGDFSLEMPTIGPKDQNTDYSLFVTAQEKESGALCTTCLRITASFSTPLLQKEEAIEGGEMVFICHSAGGFPEPVVHWFINRTQVPPEESVRTLVAPQPDSNLYNITSHLMLNVSQDSSVSCSVENQPMNETLTFTILGSTESPVVGRASEAMWMFSTGLCAVVGVLVAVGVGYQIHLDRISKKKKRAYEHSIRAMKVHKEKQMKQEKEMKENAERAAKLAEENGMKRKNLFKEETEEMVEIDPKETDV